ncbi:hypothetical protein Mapa_006678 [Marchantia paleacea]|nr:hypothetical protein Mapa_006678 [Marchantia paleacea]
MNGTRGCSYSTPPAPAAPRPDPHLTQRLESPTCRPAPLAGSKSTTPTRPRPFLIASLVASLWLGLGASGSGLRSCSIASPVSVCCLASDPSPCSRSRGAPVVAHCRAAPHPTHPPL